MRVGRIGAVAGGVVAVAVIGAAIGYAAGAPDSSSAGATVSFGTAAPIPAQPSLPIDPPPTYAPDPNYPTLQTGLGYVRETFHAGPYVWHYQVPEGWIGHRGFGANHTPQVTWEPPDEMQPDSMLGGYQLRVAPVGGHSTPAQMIASKWAGLQETQADGHLSQLTRVDHGDRAGNSAWYAFRDSFGRHRLDDFAWVMNPDGFVGLEISVAGRDRDQAGLDALLAQVRDTAHRSTAPDASPATS